MEIPEVVKILQKDSTNPNMGCLDRAIILSYFMRGKGLNPEIRCLSYENEGRRRTHYVVMLGGEVYDCNDKVTPLPFAEYKEQLNKECYNWTWEPDKEKKMREDFFIYDTWIYLSLNFDSAFQEEIKPLMKKEYEEEVAKYPYLKQLEVEQLRGNTLK